MATRLNEYTRAAGHVVERKESDVLVLSRREGQRILVGADVVITIVRIGASVRIGIEAPDSTVVLREEVAVRDAAGMGVCTDAA